MLEKTDRGLLLRKKEDGKLTWEDTYKAMATEESLFQRQHWSSELY